MLFDWFTILAQLVNFLLLVALMKHFFFSRLVKAIDGRESRIAGRLAEAEEKKHQADLQIANMSALMHEEEQKRALLLAETQRDAADLRSRMTRETRQMVEALEKKWLDDLDREKSVFLDEVRRRTAVQMLLVIRRALADLACADLQHCAVQVLLEKLPSFDLDALRAASASRDLKVLTALALKPEEEAKIRMTLDKLLGGAAPVEFLLAPELAWGLELCASGQRIGWTSESYLESLEKNLSEALQHPTESGLEKLSPPETHDAETVSQ